MQYHLQPLEYCYNTFINKEGEIVKSVYFLLEGQIEITQNSKYDFKIDQQYAQRLQRSYNYKNVQLKLNRCGYGQLFGFLEIINHQDLRQSKAV